MIPSLCLAGGIIAATLVSLLASQNAWLVLAGPLLLAASLALASALGMRLNVVSSSAAKSAWILGAAILLAGLITTVSDPARVATIIPLLGAGASVAVWGNPGRVLCRQKNRKSRM